MPININSNINDTFRQRENAIFGEILRMNLEVYDLHSVGFLLLILHLRELP